MKRSVASVFWIFLTGIIILQSGQIFYHLNDENISVCFSEEAPGDEDSDERKEPEKSTGKIFSPSEMHLLSILHFTGYQKNTEYWKDEVICPPPKL